MATNIIRTSLKKSLKKTYVNTVATALDSQVAKLPYADGLFSLPQDTRFTYEELDTHSSSLAAGLTQLSLTNGDILALWLPNNVENVICQLAAAKVGATILPIPYAEGDPASLRALLKDTGAKGFIFDPARGDEDRITLVNEAIPELPDLNDGVVLRSKAAPSLRIVIQSGFEHIPGMDNLSYTQWEDAKPDPLPALRSAIAGGHAALLTPAGAPTSHNTLMERAAALASALALTSGDRVLLPSSASPLTAATTVAACTISAAQMVLPSPELDAGASAAALASQQCTAVVADASAAAALAAAATSALPSLRAGVLDSADGASASIAGVALQPMNLAQ